MDDLDTKRLRFDVEPRELARVLVRHARAKAGPFSWRRPSGEGEIGLYLDVKKSNRDGFECRVHTIRYRKPGSSLFAQNGLHVITLEGLRVRDSETIVLIKCHKPKLRQPIFVPFCAEMEGLQQELAKPSTSATQALPIPLVTEAAQPEEVPLPPMERNDVHDGVALDDDGLDAVDLKIIEVVANLERSGLRATDELVASKLPPNPQTDLSYHRVTVNKRRCRLRDRGYNV